MDKRIEKISSVLDTNKAENIEVFDLRGKDYFVDQVVIASSLNARHTEALLNYLKNELKPAETFLSVDVSDEWVVADLGDILIHIMTPEYRAKYNMEEFLGEVSSLREED
jgi:ribosome-associated protein